MLVSSTAWRTAGTGTDTEHISVPVPVLPVLRIRIRDPGSSVFLPQGSGIIFFRIPDPIA
jgi:hypothetical protein